jgi:formate hydrogenlyase subunit 3/multisubunit Na+/H+ antiporter MnhD subunit
VGGGVYHALAHAFAKAAMFLAAGSIVRALGSDRIAGVSGIATHLPVSTYAFGIAGMTLIGLPPSGGFVAKWLLLSAALSSGQWWWGVVLLLGGVLTAGYVFLVLGQELSQASSDRTADFRPVPARMEVAAMALALLSLGLGLRAAEPLALLAIGSALAPAAAPRMNLAFWIPQAVLATSLLTALAIFLLPEERHRTRSALNLAGAGAKVALVAVMVEGALRGVQYEARLPFLPGVDLVLRVGLPGASLRLALGGALAGHHRLRDRLPGGSPHRSRFFGFFSLCVMATMGIALAGNLLTFFVFYEMLTVVTFPLVVHRGTGKALAAGRTYLLYTLGGGVLLLLGAVWLHTLAGAVEFVPGGMVAPLLATHRADLVLVFALMVAGLGVKAASSPCTAGSRWRWWPRRR